MSSIEQVTGLVSQIKETIIAITEAYALMPPIIDEEHEAISASDLDKVEALSARKLFLSSQLDASFARLKESCRRLAQIHSGNTSAEQGTLSTSFTLIEELIARLQFDGKDTSHLVNEFEQLKAKFEKFLSVKEEARRKVDVNRMVLGKMLHARQDNYRFWQEVTADTMAAYDREGKQKASRSSSILNVKA